MSKKNKRGFQPQQQQAQQQAQPAAETATAAEPSVFTRFAGKVGTSVGWFAGKVVEGFNAATTKVTETATKVTAEVKKAANAAYTKVGELVAPVCAAVSAAVSAAALAVAAAVTGVAKAIWNVRASDVLAVILIVATLVAAVFIWAAAFMSFLVIAATAAAPAGAMVAELAPAAKVALTYAVVGIVAWLVATTIEVGHWQIARMCQNVHAYIEQAARDLATSVRSAGVKVGGVLRTVDAVPVGA